MSVLHKRVVERFAARIGHPPELLVQAPGRVNLIGEHTDYNEGFVLPCAINFQTAIASGRRSDGLIRTLAADLDVRLDEFSLDAPFLRCPVKPWANYVRGAIKALLDRGSVIGGADLVIAGDVPRGAGLSSSASLLVAVIESFNTLFKLGLTPTEVALLAREAENRFVGVNVGIMDQLISARGVAGGALLIDCRSLEAQSVKIDHDIAILIVDSGIKRGLVESAYNERREQCSAAAAFFGVEALRDLDIGALTEKRSKLDDVIYRRARHIVTENQRVIEAAAALRENDLATVGRLMIESHASMRDDFEITVPKLDQLVDILNNSIAGDGGARMTGGGFGGCVVGLLPKRLVRHAKRAVETLYRTPDDRTACIYVCSAEAGAGRASD